MRLEGKTAFVTGAATGIRGEVQGIGGATAWLFAREGAKVVVADINDDLGRRTVDQIRGEGHDALFLHLDVRQEAEWVAAIHTTVSVFGRLDILVNNAGTGTEARQTVEHTTVETWDGQMAVHAKGAFLGIKHSIPKMRKTGGGSIVNISSIHGIVGNRRHTAYQAAKGAVRILTKTAAVQYASDHIRVNSVHPGYTMTPMIAPMLSSQPKVVQASLEEVPMGRLASSDEVAYGILFLASDESSFVTGAELVIDGGVIAQ
jgi:NAD(P)-dependent dehydrogenase (short-subunit alcohol dehydrogenase family)